tara:strand:- start:26378 stop:26698 length:321 start_codon:yes stop_codon:yes gene_type:complete
MSDKEYRVDFKCPACGEDGNKVEEVLTHVHQYSEVDFLGASGGTVAADYGAVSYDGDTAEVESYRCAHCCENLVDEQGVIVSDEAALLEWLKKRNMITEINSDEET